MTVDLSRQDVEPGRPVRSQLASAAKSPEEAFRRMKNKTFVVETKFDGQSSLPSCRSIASAANAMCTTLGPAVLLHMLLGAIVWHTSC